MEPEGDHPRLPAPDSGLALGAGLTLGTREGRAEAPGWTDPEVLGAAVTWWVFAALLLARYLPAMRGRRMMVFTAVAFAVLVLSGIGATDGRHLPRRPGGRPGARRRRMLADAAR